MERLIETLVTIQIHCIFLYRVDDDWGCHFALHLPLFQQKKYMCSWRIDVSYGVSEKCKKNKNSNIDDKPLSWYL